MNKLSDRMWITRKVRINMEKRLNFNYKICTYLIPWYSILLIAVSIIPSNVDSSIRNTFSVLGSIIVLVVSLLLSQKDFKQECRQVKEQYISIGKLISDAYSAENRNDSTANIEDQYDQLLRETENHSEYDYKKVIIQCFLRKTTNPSENNTVPNPSFFEWSYFIIRNIVVWLIIILIYLVIPIGIFIWLLS